MAFVKVLKNKAYFKRFQVKRRRRREGKTDYKARRALVRQDKNKYNNRKYRLVVRFTNKRVLCQVIYPTVRGDFVVAAADSTELTKYGVPVGHKNYAAAYCTGLLIARRVLKHFDLDGKFQGKKTADGQDYHIEDEENEQRPLKCILDVGLQSTTQGHRMWGALKGAVDGGLHIPHNNKRFPGYKPPSDRGGQGEYDAEAHKEKILGGHVKDYMEMMKEEDPTKFDAHFAKFIENDIEADGLEDMYIKAHAQIRADPVKVKGKKKEITHKRDGNQINSSDGTTHDRCKKITLEQRKAKVAAKIAKAQAKLLAGDS